MPSSDCIVDFPTGQSRYSGSSPERILNYLERGNERGFCYDMSGRPLAGAERRALIDYANDCGFRRLGTLSLRWGNDLSDREYLRGAREFFSEFVKDRPSLRVAWSVHRDTEHHHIQFTLIGSRNDCWTSKREWERLCELGRRSFIRERERLERCLERQISRGYEFKYGGYQW